jgi:hypothetical protein
LVDDVGRIGAEMDVAATARIELNTRPAAPMSLDDLPIPALKISDQYWTS